MEKEVRKGPWTEQEDVQLVFYVKLFGDRRWDFVAKVSGLKRTGKSCRLRWVNYLHPGLKRGKMTPHEERLVLELHAKWGNRWSRIARKLPGRTDNEIKNYWRTYTRKTAQEKKNKKATAAAAASSPSSPSSSSSSSSSSSNSSSASIEGSIGPIKETDERSFYDTGGKNTHVPAVPEKQDKSGLEIVAEDTVKVYSMDEIWKDIELNDGNVDVDFTSQSPPATWDFCPVATDSLWCLNEEDENKMLKQTANCYYQFGSTFY